MSSTVLNKMSQLKLHGMLHTYESMLDNLQHHDLTQDELINILIQSEWENRENKKINRHLRLARFRYAASIEEINFVASRGLDKTQVLRLADGAFIQKKRKYTHHRCHRRRQKLPGLSTRPPGLPAWIPYSVL